MDHEQSRRRFLKGTAIAAGATLLGSADASGRAGPQQILAFRGRSGIPTP
jgi:TAT (twin-arginine translocation) pathway signal sequence